MAAPVWLSETLEEYIRGEKNSGIDVVASGINKKDIKLVDVVEQLGPYLTSNETTIRARGVRLLADVLHRLPRDLLNDTEVTLLSAFFCDRLQDHHSITAHTLFGLLAVSGFAHLADGNAVKIVQAIFKEVQVQTLTQVDRRSVYNVINNFLQSRLAELQSLGSEFVYGYMQVMDAEKDPRNLVIAFQLVQLVVRHFPFDIFAEELFEVTACYFPIDFRPAPDDPHGITQEELILGLRGCLSATPKFAQYCLPMLMEKLSSELQSAKLDTYHTLIACAPVYGTKHMKEYVEAIWSYCRKEVFIGMNDELEQAALDTLRCVIITMATDANCKQDLLTFLENIFKECEKHINEPGLRLIHPSSRLLQAMSSASEIVCDKIMGFVLPLLIQQFHKQTQSSQRKIVVDIICGFLGICAITLTSSSSPRTSIQQHQDAILKILFSVLGESNPQIHQSALGGLSHLVRLPELLDEKELNLIAEHLIKISTTETEENTRNACCGALQCLAEKQPSLVKDKVLPALWKQLQADIEPMEVDGQGDSTTSHLVSHSDLLGDVAIMATGDPTLVKHISSEVLQHLSKLSQGSLVNQSEAFATGQCLLRIVEKNRSTKACLQYFHDTLLPSMLRIPISVAMSNHGNASNVILCQEDVLRCIASVIRNVALTLDPSYNVSSLLKQFQVPGKFECLKVSSPWPHTQLVMLLSSVICSVPRDAVIPACETLTKDLLSLATQHTHNITHEEAAKCLAGLLNKYNAGSQLDNMIEHVKQELTQCGNKEDELSKQRALSTWIWVTKALLLRSHPSFNTFLVHLLSLLEDDHLGPMAANSFRIMLCEYEDILNQSMHADIKLMYKQRLFLQTLPKIVEGFDKTEAAKKKHYLQALSHLLHYVPRQVLLSELPPLMPLMVQSLTQDDSALYLSTLETLHSLTADAPDIVSQHVDSLLPSVLKLTGYESSMKVRIAAVKSIGAMTSLPHHVVFPHKNSVVRGLGVRLDDKKRLVRKEAVAARSDCIKTLLQTVDSQVHPAEQGKPFRTCDLDYQCFFWVHLASEIS